MPAQSLLVVVSGPSGSGKGTLCNMLREALPDLSYSISLTTRPPRGDEQNGVEYFFVTEEEFKKRIEAGEFLEWAEVYGYYYGTLLFTVEKLLSEGRNVLLPSQRPPQDWAARYCSAPCSPRCAPDDPF